MNTAYLYKHFNPLSLQQIKVIQLTPLLFWFTFTLAKFPVKFSSLTRANLIMLLIYEFFDGVDSKL